MHIRPYNQEEDFSPVSDFLIDIYRPGDTYAAWLQPRWEYAHYHPSILELDVTKFGIAEQDGQIKGVVNFKSNEGEVFIHTHPDHPELKIELLDYAEQLPFQGISRSTGRLFRVVTIYDHDTALTEAVQAHGYERWDKFAGGISRLPLDEPIPPQPLPEGYRLQSLADENDLRKVNQVLWRGFNHEGPPPEEEIPGREFAQSAPNYRKDLTIVAVAPNGDYVSFGGIWFVPKNKLAYVEPVATDPDYRRMGLGRAVVLESCRRAAALGAQVAWVGSDLEFYLAMGFKRMFTAYPWAIFLD